jgi:membrane protein implicated in regulation of membrane protease activity
MLLKSTNAVDVGLNSPQSISLLAMRYHEQALLQNQVLFWVCLVAGSIILGIAIGLVLYALLTPGISFGVAAVDMVISLFLKVVSALFYKQMKESRDRNTALYDRIRQDDRITKSAQLASNIPDPRIQSTTMAKLALVIAAAGQDLQVGRQD